MGPLKRLREQKGFTQLALAKRSGVAQSYISELEAAKQKNPSLEILKKLATARGVPVTELLG